MKTEQVCAMDPEKGPLVVTTDAKAQAVRLVLRRDPNRLVYATYVRTDQHDLEGRPLFRWTDDERGGYL